MSNTGNRGIQGTNVHVRADALAVGDHARAVSSRLSVGDRRALDGAVESLRAALDALTLDPAAQAAVKNDMSELTDVARAPEVHPERVRLSLTSIIARLSSVGIIVTQVASLADPIKKIAALVRLGLQGLGW